MSRAHRPIMACRSGHLLLVMAVLCSLLLSGCSSVSYYGQAATGQLGLMLARKDIDRLINDPDTDPELQRRLSEVQRARQFAIDELALGETGSYRSFVDLNREYVVWNVVAADEFSVQANLWCFPIAGCVPYKGFFSPGLAEREAAKLRRQGLDVAVSGAVAYSTLGYLRDPVLSSMLRYSDRTLAGLIFHEMAHQRLYLPGDTEFNEAYATAIERAGLIAWDQAMDRAAPDSAGKLFNAQVRELLLNTRRQLGDLYACETGIESKRTAKASLFTRLREDYQLLRHRHPEQGHWDGFFERPLNNADLALFAAYEARVEPILAVLAELDGDWQRFHQEMEAIAQLPEADRYQRLGIPPRAAEPDPNCQRWQVRTPSPTSAPAADAIR